jgi:hypothetical protein
VLPDDLSRNVTGKVVECTERSALPVAAALPHVPATSEEALRLAIRLAVDEGEYERAATLIDVALRTTPKSASTTALAIVPERGRGG